MAKTKDPLMAQARREVRSTVVRPQLQSLKRARRAGKQDFNEAQQRVAQVTGALLGQLGKIPGAYEGQTSGIIGDVTSGIGALGDQLGQNSIGQVPLAEQNAGIANVKAIGSGAIEQIAGQQQNMADYLASGAQQGAVQGAVTSRNYLKDYSDFTKDIRQQKIDVIKSSRDQILNRLDQLKQERFDRSMALKQLGMQQAQIDQANRQLDAQIWLMQQEAKRRLKADKKGDRNRDQQTDTTDTGGGGGNDYGVTSNEAWWPPGETAYGGNAGALGQGLTPQTTLPPNADPQTVLRWIQGQPLSTVAGIQQTAQQLAAWVGGTVNPDGTVSVPPGGGIGGNYADFTEKAQVVSAFNSMIGGA